VNTVQKQSRGGQIVAAQQLMVPRLLVLTGDSETQGGNGGQQSGMTFSGNGYVGTITGISGVVGETVFLNGFASPEWNGPKVITAVDATKVTILSPVVLSASPRFTSTSPNVFYDWQENGRNFMCQANGLMKLPFRRVVNRAGSGWLTADIAAAFQDNVLALGPDVIWDHSGTNDMLAGTSELVVFAQQKVMIDAGVASGALYLLAGIPPIGTAAVGYTAAKNQTLLRLNELRREYALSNPGIVYVDCYAAVAVAATGDWDTTLTQDSIHYNARGSWEVALLVQSTLAKWFSQQSMLVSSQIDNLTTGAGNKQLFPNPLIQGAGGAGDGSFTGVAANNFFVQRYAGAGATTVGSVVARTVVADGDALGNNQRLVVTNAVNNDQVLIQGNASLSGSVSTGDVVQFKCVIGQASVTNLAGWIVQLEGTVNGVDFQILASGPTGGLMTQKDIASLELQTKPFKIPPGLTYLRPVIRFIWGGAGGGTFNIGRFGVTKLTYS
jgi:hypothetical protein